MYKLHRVKARGLLVSLQAMSLSSLLFICPDLRVETGSRCGLVARINDTSCFLLQLICRIQFFDYNTVSLTQFDPSELSKALRLHCQSLMSNNSHTRNFQTMLMRLVDSVRACKEMTSIPYR